MPDEFDKEALRIAFSTVNKILKINFTRNFIEPKQAPKTGLLFHYTTAEGLKGIIEENELWATSAYFLNDSSEITYGYGVLDEVLNEWITKNPCSENSLSVELARDLQRGFGQDLLKRNIIHPVYVVCFCEEDNLLSQWRAYGQTGGYSLGFKVASEGQTLELMPESDIYTAKWLKVCYERDEQVKRCQAILEAVLPILDDADTARAVEAVYPHEMVGYPGIRRFVSEMLLGESLSFKNKAFEAEKEWRIVVRRREFPKQDDGGGMPPAYFRSLRGMLTPYVKLIPKPAESLPLACLRSGPTLEKTTAGMAVRMMLDQNGFPNVRVEGSDIPVKF
jgi:hypothetical protein